MIASRLAALSVSPSSILPEAVSATLYGVLLLLSHGGASPIIVFDVWCEEKSGGMSLSRVLSAGVARMAVSGGNCCCGTYTPMPMSSLSVSMSLKRGVYGSGVGVSIRSA